MSQNLDTKRQLEQEVVTLRKKIADTDRVLKLIWSGLELGAKVGPKNNPCELFMALLEMHGLKRT